MLHFILFLISFLPFSLSLAMEDFTKQSLAEPNAGRSTPVLIPEKNETDNFDVNSGPLTNNKSPLRKQRRRSLSLTESPSNRVLEVKENVGILDQENGKDFISQEATGNGRFDRKQKHRSLGKPSQNLAQMTVSSTGETQQTVGNLENIIPNDDEDSIPTRALKQNRRLKKGRSLGTPGQRSVQRPLQHEEMQNEESFHRTLKRKSSSRRNIYENSEVVVRNEPIIRPLRRGLSKVLTVDETIQDHPLVSPRNRALEGEGGGEISPRMPLPSLASPRGKIPTNNPYQLSEERRSAFQKRKTKKSMRFMNPEASDFSFDMSGEDAEESTDGRSNALIHRDEEGSLTENIPLMDEISEEYELALTPYYSNLGSASLKEVLDKGFFNPPFSWPIFIGGALGTICGMAPSTPVTGMLMYLTGNFLHLPIGEWTNFFPISTTMMTLTPIYMRQFYERGQILGAYLSCYKQYEEKVSAPVTGIGAEYTWEVGYKYSFSHHAFNGLAFLSAAVRSLCLTGIMIVAEENFPVVRGITGPFFFLSFLDQYYSLAKRNLNNTFNDKVPQGNFTYSNLENKDQDIEDQVCRDFQRNREDTQHLLLMIQEFRKAMEENDETAKKSFGIIKNEIDILKGKSIDSKQYFALSALLFKPKDCDDNPRILTSILPSRSPLTKFEDFFSYLYILSKGGGLIVRPIIIEYMLERVGTDYFGLPVNGAVLTACVGAGLELASKVITEYKSVRDYSSLRISFTDFSRPSLARILTFPCAGFFTIAGVYLGWENLSRWGTPSIVKGGMLASFVVDDLPPHSKFLTDKLDDLMQAAVTTLPACIGDYVKPYVPESVTSVFTRCIPSAVQGWWELYNQRSWLRKWSQDFYESIDMTFDAVSLASLYVTTQLNDEDYVEPERHSVIYHQHYFGGSYESHEDSSSIR